MRLSRCLHPCHILLLSAEYPNVAGTIFTCRESSLLLQRDAKRPGFSLLSEVEVVTKRINTSSLGGPLLPEWNVGLWKPPGEHGHALCRVSLECVFGSQ
jgi:hypothetical protein